MQYFQNQLAIEATWLIDNGVMTIEAYKSLSRRKDIHVLQRGCRNCNALVAYDSLPERFKNKVLQIIPDPHQTARENILEPYLEHSGLVSLFFDQFVCADGRSLPETKRREYYANAIVLKAIDKLIEARIQRCRARGVRKHGLWDGIMDAVRGIDINQWPVNLPANERRLQDKLNQWKAEGNECLIHQSYIKELKNASKVATEDNQAMLATLISDPRNLDDAQVARLYNEVSKALGWRTISSSTVANWRTRFDNVTYARRHGGNAFLNNKAMQVRRSAPTAPLYMWVMDGWDIELMYQKKTGNRITYHNRLTMVVVIDAYCNYPIGYAIGENESPALIREALRSASRQTELLFGQMYQVNQLQSDNYQISNLKPLYEQVSDKITPAKVGNAKSKIIERWFLYFNKKYCQLQTNWSGFGITSDKKRQPNVDYLNKYRKDFPDFAGVCEQVVRFLEAERAELREKYTAGFGLTAEERRLPMSREQYLLAYGSMSEGTNLLQGNGITKQIEGHKYFYDCFNPQFRNYATTRWHVLYDPDDMHYALAVNDDHTLQFLLEEKYVQPMALCDRNEGDYNELKRVFDYNDRQREAIAKKLGGYQQTARALVDNHRELETLNKLMITDSKGQHKDRRNDERLQRALPVADAEQIDVFETHDRREEFDASATFDMY